MIFDLFSGPDRHDRSASDVTAHHIEVNIEDSLSDGRDGRGDDVQETQLITNDNVAHENTGVNKF